MIRKKSYGHPFDTEAVVGSYTPLDGPLPFLTEEGGGRFSCPLDEDAVVYGLGENVRGINKRGWIYESVCSDDPNHREDTRSLYGAHNFLVVDGARRFGVFVDYPGKVTFDVGYTDGSVLTIQTEEPDLALYLIDGDSPEDIVRQFRTLVGRSYIPPKWAFGYGQSRWSYMNADEVREVAARYREAGIPLDAIYLDIDYMEGYKDFTVNRNAFPDLSGLAAELKEQGIRLVPIIDAGVKIEPGYPVYEEGVRQGCFCKDEDGSDFVAAVWPGRVHFPDVLNEEARRWFGGYYKVLLEQGIEGFWNDMNEPAIFYSEQGLENAFSQIDAYRTENLDIHTYGALQGLVAGLKNSPEDYRSFYHRHKDGLVRHDRVHNLYGYNMTRAAGEAMEALEPEKRILLFSRSSYIGMHRYGGIWTGDNLSWWSHILLNLQMMPSLNMCGFLYTGADLGGFGGDTTEDLLLRWMALGIFTPLMRNHSATGTRRQELYRFPHVVAFRQIVSLRYVLLPYLYSEYMKAALGNGMYFRPLAFAYPEDAFARRVEDQLMVGESVMIAPVYQQHARGRYVYLPERMKLVRFGGSHQAGQNVLETVQEELLEPGHHYIDVALDEVVFFLRPGHLVPVSQGGGCVADVDFTHLKLLGYPEDGCSYELYDDDGFRRDYDTPAHITRIYVDSSGVIHTEGTGGKDVQWL